MRRQQKLPFMYPEAVPHEVLSSPDNLMRVYNEDKRILRLIQARDSQLVDAVKTGNITNVRKLVMSRIMAGHTDRYNMLNHSSDPDVQKRIEDKVRDSSV